MDGGKEPHRRRAQVGDLIRFRHEILRDGFVELWNEVEPEHDIFFPLPFRLIPCRSYALVIGRAVSSCKVVIDGDVGWVDDCDIEPV